MVLDKTQFSVVLYGMEKVMRLAAKWYPAFQKRLAERNLIAQFQLRDNSQGRTFFFQDGKVSSKAGIHPNPDLVLSFEDAATAGRFLSPFKDQMDFISAVKAFQMETRGSDENVVWFSETMNMMLDLGADFGVDMGKGVTRYTNCTNGGPVFVYVKDGKIIRITPMDFDDEDADPWVITAHGKKFSPPKKATLSPYGLAWKSMIYSKDRLLYPMKRVDFDPNGERNPQNRGISGYERISWDEALDIVAKEIKHAKQVHGPGAILNGSGSHHTWGAIGYWLSARLRFFNTLGFTPVGHNPDSWEGWYWGASHHWGQTAHNGGGETYNTVEDLMQNSEMVVFWSSDPEATSGVYGAGDGTIRRQWLKDLNIPVVHIDPYYNHTAALFPGKWLAPKPGTDNAMVLAIAYVWITEDLYDKEYVATRTHGFDKWKTHVLGEDDGIPKSPEWQEAETGIPAKDIRALAREWGTKRTYLASGGIVAFGGACRQSTGTDWARGMVYLMGMQGLGKPGVNMGGLQQGTPVDTRFFWPGYSEGGMSADTQGTGALVNMYQRMPQTPSMNTVQQMVPRLKIPEAIMEGQCEGYPTDPRTIEGQFFKYGYPSPGHSRVSLYYKYGGSHFGTMVDTNRYAKMYRSESLECVVNQSIWFEGEAKYADIILPACTNFERWDIGEHANCGGYIQHSFTQSNHRVIVMQHKAIEPLGESKSDYQIFKELADRLGVTSVFTEGSSEFDWCKRYFAATDVPRKMSWKKFLKRGYYVVPPLPEDRRDPVSYRWFYEGRPKDTPELTPLPGDYTDGFRKGLGTQTGKIEFESSSLKRFDPDDPERPPVMKYRQSWEGPNTTELFKKYPLQLMSPHPKFSFHTMGDGKDSVINDVKDHRVLVDGWYYWVARINSQDAAARGIKDNDLIKLYNDRGAVVCAAQVTDRLPPGVVHSYESCAVYAPVGKPGESVDRGGCINNLTSSRMIIKKSHGMCNSTLLEVCKWNGEESFS
ncbi:molybdopterin-dependent oxidoreductase [Holophaga foetida]|uniref:molybdopterin-dependent oxidoreductase n=1 Tax=Holophaga foetida TaxID=35839 RepID=UPI0002473F51|nr:molybdopterin-dependent oxidoreductase [Holophaga foetida]